MKKFTSLMAATVAVSFGAFAQVPEPENLTELLVNPSFENVDDMFEGWTAIGNMVDESLWQQFASSWAGNNSDGEWVIRMMNEGAGVNPGNVISQEIESPKDHGTYVVACSAVVSRNSMRDDMKKNKWWTYLFIADESTENPTMDNNFPSSTEIVDNGWGKAILRGEAGDPGANCPTYLDADKNLQYGGLEKFYAVITTTDQFLTIGWCVPSAAEGWNGNYAGIGKPNIIIDNFELFWYDTEDTDAVINAVAEQKAAMSAVNVVEVAPVENGKIFNLQGIEVKEAVAPGIYIQNGKKFIVK